jgi:hypothetical protein
MLIENVKILFSGERKTKSQTANMYQIGVKDSRNRMVMSFPSKHAHLAAKRIISPFLAVEKLLISSKR